MHTEDPAPDRASSGPSDVAPRWTARAPGRVNLIGEHVDYSGGWVLPMAIEREVTIAAWPRSDDYAVFHSEAIGDQIALDLTEPAGTPVPPWGRYLQGVIEEFARRTGTSIPGFEARIASTVPVGAGLSSSAALEVAAMSLLERITGVVLPPVEKAMLCREVEHEYAGVPCGIMDQMVSVLGVADHLLLIDCTSREARPIPLDAPDLVVLVMDTGVSHALADSAYAERRAECARALSCLGARSYRDLGPTDIEGARAALGPVLFRRARHVTTENRRTLAAVGALAARDWDGLGAALYGSHDSLAQDYEVSCPELDLLVESAREIGSGGGVIGARMTGGGFGGCTVSLVWRDRVADVTAQLQGDFARHFGRIPTCFVTRPAAGSG